MSCVLMLEPLNSVLLLYTHTHTIKSDYIDNIYYDCEWVYMNV